MYHIIRLHFLVDFVSSSSLSSLSCLYLMDPKGKAPAPTPPYRRDAQKGYLPSVPFPHAGPEPSDQAPRSFHKGNSLETYPIICAVKKYQSWIGTNRVEILTDHRSLEYWSTEHVNTVSSPAGRRARWHAFLSLFDLHVAYLPGKYNTVADA